MSIVLEIEYLTGICFAALDPDSDLPDWPPQPDRIFSALVSTWGARGEKEEEARALEWLEAQPAPKIEASEHCPRSAPISFVPPNDPETGRSGNESVMPLFRCRQARRFPATRPHVSVVRIYWSSAAPDDSTFAALKTLAFDTSYVGHSASLTRCLFLRLDEARAPNETMPARRHVYSGRLAELRSSYQMFCASNGKRGRPLRGVQVRIKPAADRVLPCAFGDRWLLLEHVAGQMPDIRASAIVAKAIRDVLLSGYKRIGLEDSIPEVVSGHGKDGSPSRTRHLAIVPLAFAGFAHADGHVLGFALVPPSNSGLLDDNDFRRALRKIAPLEEDLGRRVLRLRSRVSTSRERAFSVGLSPTFEPTGLRSLDPRPYITPARAFATVTPIVLDRHLKEKQEGRQTEIIEQISAACRNVGLPEPLAIIPDKHSAVEGMPSAWPSAKAPSWMNWRLPASLASRQLIHAVFHFDEPVRGPVILGAGRFVGLGLCRPLRERRA